MHSNLVREKFDSVQCDNYFKQVKLTTLKAGPFQRAHWRVIDLSKTLIGNHSVKYLLSEILTNYGQYFNILDSFDTPVLSGSHIYF